MAMTLGSKGYKSEINITPYIDILLVLLIIFMVATPVKKYDQQVRVPKPAPVQVQQTVDPLIIEVDLNKDIRLNQRPLPFGDLEKTLYAVLSSRSDKNMYIRADSGLQYGYIFQILDLAKRAGAFDIALLKKESSTSTPSTGEPAPEVASAR
jgi:biopolymer transport protein TolR